MKNRFLSVLLIVFFLLGSMNVVAADEFSYFDGYVTAAMSHLDTLYVTTGEGADITDEFIFIIQNYGLDQAHRFAIQSDCCIAYQEIVDSSDVMPYALSQSASVTNYFYHLQKDTTGKFQKEWQTKLSGTYWYDIASDQIKSANSPILTLAYTNFGAAFSPYMDSVSTSYNINKSSNTVTFSGTYHMYATLGISIGDFPVGFTFDFSSHRDRFSASR